MSMHVDARRHTQQVALQFRVSADLPYLFILQLRGRIDLSVARPGLRRHWRSCSSTSMTNDL